MFTRSHEGASHKRPEYRGRRAFAALMVPLGLTGLAACGEAPNPTPALTASPNPGDKTPDVSASPTDKTDFDAFHDDLATKDQDGNITAVKSLQEVFPLPEQLTADYLDDDANAGEIAKVFPITAAEAKTPEDAMRAWYLRENAMANLGSSKSSMETSADGSDTVLTQTKQKFLTAWRALNGYSAESMPPQSVLNNMKVNVLAFENTSVARVGGHPAFMPLVAKIPNFDSLEVTKNSDGTYDATIDVRVVLYVDNANIQLMDPTIEFKNTDSVEKATFKNCGIDKKTDTFHCDIG